MKHQLVVDIDEYNGFNPFLFQVTRKTLLEHFFESVSRAEIQYDDIFVSYKNTIDADIKDILSAFTHLNINFLPIETPPGSMGQSRYHRGVELLKMCNRSGEGWIHFYPWHNTFFDPKVVSQVLDVATRSHARIVTYQSGSPQISFSPILIRQEYIEEILSFDAGERIDFLQYPVYAAVREWRSHTGYILFVVPEEPVLGLKYDLPFRSWIRTHWFPHTLTHIRNFIETSCKTSELDFETIHKAFTFPDRFGIEIARKPGKNLFVPDSSQDRPATISLETVGALLTSLEDFPCPLHLDLIGSGDPLAHPQISEIFQQLVEFRSRRNEKFSGYPVPTEISLYSDAAGLSEMTARAILDSEIDNVLFNSYTGAESGYAETTGNPWSEFFSRINQFLSLKYQYMESRNQFTEVKPQTAVTMILSKKTEGNINTFLKTFNRKSNYIPPGKEPGPREWETFYKTEKYPLEHAVIIPYSTFCGRLPDESVTDFRPLKRFPCRKLLCGCTVLTDGRVTICDLDLDGTYSYSTVPFSLSQDFLSNQTYQTYRRNQVEDTYDDPPLCSNCDQFYIPVY